MNQKLEKLVFEEYNDFIRHFGDEIVVEDEFSNIICVNMDTPAEIVEKIEDIASGFNCDVYLILKDEIFSDGHYKGPISRLFYDIVNGDFIWDTDYGMSVIDSIDDLLTSGSFAKHPSRAATMLREITRYQTVEIDDQEISSESDFYLVYENCEYSSCEIPPKLVFKSDLIDLAWKDCRNTTDDHDDLYYVIRGPHAGKVLRDYASRWQGSPDYECELMSIDKAMEIIDNYIIDDRSVEVYEDLGGLLK